MKSVSRREALRTAFGLGIAAFPALTVGCRDARPRSVPGDTATTRAGASPVGEQPSPTLAATATTVTPPANGTPSVFAVACPGVDAVAFVDIDGGAAEQVPVGASPWGMARLDAERIAVSCAREVTVVDVVRRIVVGRIGLGQPAARAQTGEFRPGAMGIAISGGRAFVGVYPESGPSQVEIIDLAAERIVASIPVGARPFDVLATPDGRAGVSIDHDGYSVTVIETATLVARTVAAAPIGRGAYDKPHYAAVRADGRLLLPYQGTTLLELDIAGGSERTWPLTADTHQHGIVLSPDGRQAAIVGTGPAGGARRGPSLTLFDLDAGREHSVVPLRRAHERIAFTRDGGRLVLGGGYLLDGGWDGLTVFDLATGSSSEVAVPGRPLCLMAV